MKTDTPRTDAKKFLSRGTASYHSPFKEVVLASDSETLERELTAMTKQRDEARKYAIFWQSLAEGRGRADDGDAAKAMTGLIGERDEAREQRDRLAEDLKQIYNVSLFDYDSMPEVARKKYREVVFAIADKALQSITQQTVQ